MPYQIKKNIVVSDDEILIDFIGRILSLFDEYQSDYISTLDVNNINTLEGVKYLLIDERKDVKNLLTLNQKIKTNYPDIILMIVTEYIDGEYDAQFINSGADYVIPVNKLDETLSGICEKDTLPI